MDEVAAVLRLAPRTAGNRMATAMDLVSRFPPTLGALSRGEITLEHARALSDEALGVDDAVAATVESHVPERAAGKTPAQFRACARRAVASLDVRPPEVKPDPREDRCVCSRFRNDGMAEIRALLAADDAATLMNTLTQMAYATRGMDDRTAEQRRADALADLGRGELRPGGGPAVEVIVSLSTLLGLDEQAGELKGAGPVPAEVSGNYRSPAAVARFVKNRDVTCRFPGCRASRNEVDHIVPWPRGATEPSNLHLLCARHHHLKHEAGWSVHRTADGVTHWTSPTGRHFAKPPDERPVDTTMAGREEPAPF